MSKCYTADCSQQVTFKCTCNAQSLYFCANHIGVHLTTPGNHSQKNILTEIDNTARQHFVRAINSFLTLIDKWKLDVVNKTNDIIAEAQQKCEEIHISLNKIGVMLTIQLRNYMGKKYANNESKEYFEVLLRKNSEAVKKEVDSWKLLDMLKLLEAGKNNFYSKLYENNIQDKYFDLVIRSISASINNKISDSFTSLNNYVNGANCINYISTTQYNYYTTPIDLESPITSPAYCNIPGNMLFVGGGRFTETQFSKSYFLVNLTTNQIVYKTVSDEREFNCGNLFHKMNIYYFGRYTNGRNFSSSCKFNLESLSWSNIADFPEANIPSSCISYFNDILLVGNWLNCVHRYSPQENLYSKSTFPLKTGQYKGLLRHKNQVFLLYDNKIFEAENNQLSSWKEVGNFKYPKDLTICEAMETANAVVFRSNASAFRMDVATKVVTCIIDLGYSEMIKKLG